MNGHVTASAGVAMVAKYYWMELKPTENSYLGTYNVQFYISVNKIIYKLRNYRLVDVL